MPCVSAAIPAAPRIPQRKLGFRSRFRFGPGFLADASGWFSSVAPEVALKN